MQIAVLAGVGALVAARDGAAAGQKVERGDVDKAADADRGVGARDQEGAREAAAGHGLARHRRGAHRPRQAGGNFLFRQFLRLGQLVDSLLQELLIGLQVRQLVGACPGKSRQQHDRRGRPADRR